MRVVLIVFTALLLLLNSSCEEIDARIEHESPTVKNISRPVALNPPAAAADSSVCIAAVGDIMLGTSYPDNRTLPPGHAKNSFKNIKDELNGADIAFGNLEGTLLDTGSPAYFKLHQLIKSYLFRMPVRKRWIAWAFNMADFIASQPPCLTLKVSGTDSVHFRQMARLCRCLICQRPGKSFKT